MKWILRIETTHLNWNISVIENPGLASPRQTSKLAYRWERNPFYLLVESLAYAHLEDEKAEPLRRHRTPARPGNDDRVVGGEEKNIRQLNEQFRGPEFKTFWRMVERRQSEEARSSTHWLRKTVNPVSNQASGF